MTRAVTFAIWFNALYAVGNLVVYLITKNAAYVGPFAVCSIAAFVTKRLASGGMPPLKKEGE